MTPRRQRMMLVILVLLGVGTAAALTLNAFRGNMVYFYGPSQLGAVEKVHERNLRLGGLVEQGSIKREDDGLTVHFMVTDTVKNVPVIYKGILPDLFREGQGVIAQGKLSQDGVFMASEVLAKHDENYMPPEVAKAMQEAQKNAPQFSSTLMQGGVGK
ncbi:MAG: cytochrome c maturation protein CcmE [Gammaproteobacteria bacterium]